MLKHAKGFTVLELLVVMSVMAILAGILFPVYSTAKIRSKRVVCMNNLKQIGNALLMYAKDWDGCAPPYTMDRYVLFTYSYDPLIMIDLRPFNSYSSLKQCFAPYGAGKDATWHCPLGSKNDNGSQYFIDPKYAILRPLPIDNPPVLSKDEYNKLPKTPNPAAFYFKMLDDGAPIYACCNTHPLKEQYYIAIRLDGSLYLEKE